MLEQKHFNQIKSAADQAGAQVFFYKTETKRPSVFGR